MVDESAEIAAEIGVLKREFDFILKEEIPVILDELTAQINIILQYLTKSFDRKSSAITSLINQSRLDRLNLVTPQVGLEGIKCSLNMNAYELSNIEINYKPTQRHNNYIYKSKEDCVWHLHQVANCGDTLKTLVSYINNLNIPFVSYDQAMFHIEHLLDEINAARNILLFPKKRLIPELQSQKNMKIFPLVPNDLVFSFYIQGYKLVLAIYVIKGSETSRYTLDCSSITWLNNVMILLTSCLQKLQQLKDKLNIFDQVVLVDEQNQSVVENEPEKNKSVLFNQESDSEIFMKLKQLESALQEVKSFENAKLNYEQYITTPHLASQIIFAIENQYGDISESVICDLGIGTGMLSIGCSLMGADLVYGIDIDKDALRQCSENIDYFDIMNIELLNADCKQLLKLYEYKKKSLFDFEFDTIIMNPPFGTKYQSNQIFEKELKTSEIASNQELAGSLLADSTLGVDMQFLKLASKMAKHSIYSLNKSCTRDFIKKFSSNLGLNMEIISELRYNIPKVEQENNKTRSKVKTAKPDKDIEVDFIRFSYS